MAVLIGNPLLPSAAGADSQCDLTADLRVIEAVHDGVHTLGIRQWWRPCLTSRCLRVPSRCCDACAHEAINTQLKFEYLENLKRQPFVAPSNPRAPARRIRGTMNARRKILNALWPAKELNRWDAKDRDRAFEMRW